MQKILRNINVVNFFKQFWVNNNYHLNLVFYLNTSGIIVEIITTYLNSKETKAKESKISLPQNIKDILSKEINFSETDALIRITFDGNNIICDYPIRLN